jgi:phosphomannomutase
MSSNIAHIFRSYDIRATEELTPEVMRNIANVFAQHVNKIAIGMDGRKTSPELKKAFILGAAETGASVTDLAMLPMGAAMFHAWKSNNDLAYITGSHLEPEWNGVKFFHKNGIGYAEQENYAIRDDFLAEKFITKEKGKIQKKKPKEIISEYINFLTKKLKPEKPLKILIDCGNGMASLIAKSLFEKTGCQVDAINDNIDPNFSARGPDPAKEKLDEIESKAKNYDIGIAYDGDGDRMALIDNKGNFVSPEQTSYLILSELLKHEQGPIIATVECGRIIDDIAKGFNRKVIKIPVGHTFLMHAAHKHKASFGVEVSGHYSIPSIIPFDDSLAVSLYAVVALSRKSEPMSEAISKIRVYPLSRQSFDCSDDKKFSVITSLQNKFPDANTMDGLRIDLDNAWVLIRASNTGPVIRLTIEADTETDLKKLKQKYSKILQDEILLTSKS